MFKYLDNIAKYWIFWDRWPYSGFITILHTGSSLVTYCPRSEWLIDYKSWYFSYMNFKPYKGFYLCFFGIEASIG